MNFLMLIDKLIISSLNTEITNFPAERVVVLQIRKLSPLKFFRIIMMHDDIISAYVFTLVTLHTPVQLQS